MTTRTRSAPARRAALAAALALGGALVMGSAKPAAAAAYRITQCGQAITVHGTWLLDRDFTCPGSDGVRVQANDVHLMLGNHTIDGQSSGGSGLFAQGVTGLSVVGGTVKGFFADVHIADSPGTRVVNTTASGGFEGIALSGNCAGCAVVGSRASGNFAGIYISSPNVRVVGNAANGNYFGIYVDQGATGNRLTGNTATGNNNTDLSDTNLPACVNKWVGNRFVTDNEVDGPGKGCIQ